MKILKVLTTHYWYRPPVKNPPKRELNEQGKMRVNMQRQEKKVDYHWKFKSLRRTQSRWFMMQESVHEDDASARGNYNEDVP